MVGGRGLTVDLRGFNQLNQRLQRLAKEDATKAGQVANRAGANALRKLVKDAAPDSPKTTEGETRTRHNRGGTTRTEVHGKIKNNVKVKKTKSTDPTQVKNAVFVSTKAYHANFVHFGSIHNTANPFMQDAFEANEQTVIDAIARSLDKQLIRRGV